MIATPDVPPETKLVGNCTKLNNKAEQNIQNAKSALESAKSENKKFEIFKAASSEGADEDEEFDSDFGNFEIP